MTRVHLVLALALVLAACSASTAGPPEVRWGVDECSGCHMILSSPEYAAVARSAGGEEARFDDLGCLAGWLAGIAGAETWQVWVHDANADRWHPAAEAWYARAEGRATPMGSGITAHATEAAAQAASPRGEPFRWSELLANHSQPQDHTTAGGSP
jgi:copper chaperone NosL